MRIDIKWVGRTESRGGSMNEETWHKIFKKYIKNYYAIHGLFNTQIIDENEKHRLLEKLLDNIMTTFECEVNE